MEKKVEVKENENGSYTKVVTTKTNPSDGFVHQPEVDHTNRNNYGKYHKGWQIEKRYETDNPKVVIPFLVFFMILVLLFPIGTYFISPKGSSVVFYLALIFAIFFEVMIVKEIIGVIKKNKK